MANTKETFLRQIAVNLSAIIIAALGAALITFLQSIASQTGVCPIPSGSPVEAASLAALLKTAHWTFHAA